MSESVSRHRGERQRGHLTPWVHPIRLATSIVLATAAINVGAASPSTGAPAANARTAEHLPGEASPAGLPLTVEDRTLRDLIEELSMHSGIRFDLNAELQEQRVSTVLDGPDWNSAIRSFLRAYSHIAMVGRDGRLQRVWITGSEATPNILPAIAARDAEANDDAPLDLTPAASGSYLAPLVLWQPTPREISGASDERGEPIQMDPTVFDALSVGQPLEIDIPQEEFPILGIVEASRAQLGGSVQVWSGPIDGSHPSASFTISRGARTTYVTVATGTHIYEVSVDNASGEGRVVDEVDMTRGKSDEDFIPVPADDGR